MSFAPRRFLEDYTGHFFRSTRLWRCPSSPLCTARNGLLSRTAQVVAENSPKIGCENCSAVDHTGCVSSSSETLIDGNIVAPMRVEYGYNPTQLWVSCCCRRNRNGLLSTGSHGASPVLRETTVDRVLNADEFQFTLDRIAQLSRNSSKFSPALRGLLFSPPPPAELFLMDCFVERFSE